MDTLETVSMRHMPVVLSPLTSSVGAGGTVTNRPPFVRVRGQGLYGVVLTTNVEKYAMTPAVHGSNTPLSTAANEDWIEFRGIGYGGTMKGSGPRYERETVITFDEQGKTAEIYTASEATYRQMLRRGWSPGIDEDRHAVFVVPKGQVKLPRMKRKGVGFGRKAV